MIEDLVGYGIKYKIYEEIQTENPKPAPIFMLVHGNARTDTNATEKYQKKWW